MRKVHTSVTVVGGGTVERHSRHTLETSSARRRRETAPAAATASALGGRRSTNQEITEYFRSTKRREARAQAAATDGVPVRKSTRALAAAAK